MDKFGVPIHLIHSLALDNNEEISLKDMTSAQKQNIIESLRSKNVNFTVLIDTDKLLDYVDSLEKFICY